MSATWKAWCQGESWASQRRILLRYPRNKIKPRSQPRRVPRTDRLWLVSRGTENPVTRSSPSKNATRMPRASQQSCSSSNSLKIRDSNYNRYTSGTGIPRRKMKNCKKNLLTTIQTWNPQWESVKRYWKPSTLTSLEATPRLGSQMESKRTATRRRVTSWILVTTSPTKCKTSESAVSLEWWASTSKPSPSSLPREKLERVRTSLQPRSFLWLRKIECHPTLLEEAQGVFLLTPILLHLMCH